MLSLAQRSRDDYRAAYRAWRQADPNLEHEAAAGGAPIAQRADRMAAEAAKSAAARKAFLEGSAQGWKCNNVSWLENDGGEPQESTATSTAAARGGDSIARRKPRRVARTIDTFANDPDRGIQQLRQTLRAGAGSCALEALGPLIGAAEESCSLR